MASAGHLSETAQAEGKQNTQAALAQFTEWFWKTHPDDYAKWKETVQKGSQAAAPTIKQDESPHQFQERVRQEGPSKFQAAMRHVHTVLEGTSSWPNWSAAQQKSCMRATQMFLLRTFSKKGLDLVASADVEAVDLRLATLCRALSSSLELQNWKFDPAIKRAIAGTDEAFARLCQAAEPLSSMDFRRTLVQDPLDVLAVFRSFSKAVITFLESKGSEPTMDSQIDVALHTIVQMTPEHLYYHVKVVEHLVWEPWAAESEAQFAIMIMTSVVVALYTVDTTHFNMDSRLFCGIMASHGFQPNEFAPRAPNTKLPPPFDTGPPLGEGLAETPSSRGASSQGASGAASNSSGAPRHIRSAEVRPKMGKHATRAYLRRLEQTGEALVQDRNVSQTMMRTYPFLLQNADDLFVKDVKELLESYHTIVLKYEGIKLALAGDM